jgi:hypothetical protein
MRFLSNIHATILCPNSTRTSAWPADNADSAWPESDMLEGSPVLDKSAKPGWPRLGQRARRGCDMQTRSVPTTSNPSLVKERGNYFSTVMADQLTALFDARDGAPI